MPLAQWSASSASKKRLEDRRTEMSEDLRPQGHRREEAKESIVGMNRSKATEDRHAEETEAASARK